MFVFLLVSAVSSLDLSIRAAILFGSNNSSFSNSDTCLTSLSIFSGFCFFSSNFSTFSIFSSGKGIASGFSLDLIEDMQLIALYCGKLHHRLDQHG